MQNNLTKSTVVGNGRQVQSPLKDCHAGSSQVRIGPPPQKTQPEIDVQKRGDRIESIVITCSCGQQITIRCDYAETKNE